MKKEIKRKVKKQVEEDFDELLMRFSEEERLKTVAKIPLEAEMPLIADKELIVFPGMSISFDVVRDSQKMALVKAYENNKIIFLTSSKGYLKSITEPDDINRTGCIVKIRQMGDFSMGNGLKVIAEGVCRGELESFLQKAPYIKAKIKKIEEINSSTELIEKAYKKNILNSVEKYLTMIGKATSDFFETADEMQSLNLFTDLVASFVSMPFKKKYELLETVDCYARAETIKNFLEEEISVLYYEKTLHDKVKMKFDKQQKEYFVREQIRVLKKELGEGTDGKDESEKYLEQLSALKVDDETRTKIRKEIERLDFHHAGSPEISNIRSYLDLVFDLPWGKITNDNLSVVKAKKILDREHYGMEKVKERITEFIAVRSIKAQKGNMDIKGPILCLAGPPGVGKTSIAKSLAQALNRKYIRMSLGGIRDEAEIRGHRRTYIGSQAGRLITAIKQANTDNPLILLDEIDKLGRDFRGDPAFALLEVLDPEQNKSFRDNYLEVSYDLSKVLFITTANNWEAIPHALFDRMEIVHIPGYTEEEKIEIAIRHIVYKQLQENGIDKNLLKFTRAGVGEIIRNYTSEAGVRELERQISKICRKVAIEYSMDNSINVKIEQKNVEKYLGKKKISSEFSFKEDVPGVVNGLAWTAVGGKLLPIEVSIFEGKGNLELTGQLGDVMKESARLAFSYIKSNAQKLGLDPLFYQNKDLHIHVPSGATQKEGPSAGTALTMALISAFINKPVSNKIAMTGEITLRGKILPVGGVKEKLIAASRFEIDKVFIPYENTIDIEEIPESVKKKFKIVPVKSIEEIIKETLDL